MTEAEVEITFIDFFSEIGGFHSGFERAGMKCVGWCEFDKYAQKSYRAIYDTKGLYFNEDVRKIRGWELPNATLWSFGFPCQDVSIAGKQKGIGRGTRSGLFFEIMRLLDEKEDDKPERIIAENVKNLLSIGGVGILMFKTERYQTMNHVRHMLREIGSFVRYMKPLHTEKRFLMKQRAMKLRAMKCKKS